LAGFLAGRRIPGCGRHSPPPLKGGRQSGFSGKTQAQDTLNYPSISRSDCIQIVGPCAPDRDKSSSGRHVEEQDSTFEKLLIQHQRAILLYIQSLMSGRPGVEDVLQNTNLVLWRKRENFEVGSNFLAWAFTIARLEVYNQAKHFRRNQRLISGLDRNDLIGAGGGGGGQAATDALHALKTCLKTLPSRDQELLLMRYSSSRTLTDYARNLKRSPGTLKARLFKIREKLRKSIEEQLSGDESRSWG
jgi:RNA polymerase sigma-70 factor (ECF subfamily)